MGFSDSFSNVGTGSQQQDSRIDVMTLAVARLKIASIGAKFRRHQFLSEL